MSPSTPDFPYFYPEEAKQLLDSQGKQLQSVSQFFWENKADNNQPLSLIMELSFLFEGGSQLTFHAPEDRSGLAVGQMNRVVEELKIQESGISDLRLREATEDENDNWEPFLGETLSSIELVTMSPGIYRNEQMIFDFGFTKVLISRPLDGIEVEELVNEDED